MGVLWQGRPQRGGGVFPLGDFFEGNTEYLRMWVKTRRIWNHISQKKNI